MMAIDPRVPGSGDGLHKQCKQCKISRPRKSFKGDTCGKCGGYTTKFDLGGPRGAGGEESTGKSLASQNPGKPGRPYNPTASPYSN